MMLRSVCVLLLTGVGAFVGAAEPPVVSVGSELARIQSERKVVEGRAAIDEAGCYQRFAVNDCLHDVRAQRRAALQDLRRQEISINDAERKARGAAQAQRADDLQAARSDAAAQTSPLLVRQPSAPIGKAKPVDTVQRDSVSTAEAVRMANPVAPRVRTVAPRKPRPDPAKTGIRYAQKQKDAAERRAKQDARNATRKKPASPPLPPPAG
jgi:colicin import membrane protein